MHSEQRLCGGCTHSLLVNQMCEHERYSLQAVRYAVSRFKIELHVGEHAKMDPFVKTMLV